MMHRRILWVVWPAFMVAGVLEIMVFAMFDPHDLHWFGQPVDWSRQGIYTVSFFVFWFMGCASSALTLLSSLPVEVINGCPLMPAERPDDCPKQSKDGCC